MAKDYQTEASVIETQYKEGLQYKKQMGFMTKWPEYERFRAGDQWPAPTDKTRNLPRPVFNIIELIQGHKVSSVMNENIKMVYSATELIDNDQTIEEAAERFNQFADVTWEDIKQGKLNERALNHASNRGTGIWHYYWDSSYKGGMSLKWVGKMCGEIIDPINYFPGNPQQEDVQKQPYIIITTRDLVENVRKEAEANKVSKDQIALINPDKDTDNQGYDSAKVELTGSSKVTVITKYWKEDGTVWFTKSCSGVIIKPKQNTNMKLYPLASMQWKEREQSAFGIGDTEGIIPNQKAINYMLAMQLLSVQLTGWPKMLVNRNFIKQTITNTPGEIIFDDSPQGAGDGAKYMNPGTVSSTAPMLVEKFVEFTKEVAGANENALGEQKSAQLNATAIMLLQKQAGVPLEGIRRRFYQSQEDCGRIWQEFNINYYNTDRNVSYKGEDGEQKSMLFNGSRYKDIEMQIKIDIGPASSFSESLMMSSLDNFLAKDRITFEQYLKYAPKNVVPFKDRLLKEIQEQQQEQQQQGPDIEQILSQLSPQEQQAFMQAPPEVQQQIIQQMQGQMQQPPQTPQQMVRQEAPLPSQPQMMG